MDLEKHEFTKIEHSVSENIRQMIMSVYNGIPEPKRILHNVYYKDLSDNWLCVDYVIFTSNGPFLIYIDTMNLNDLGYNEMCFLRFFFMNAPVNYVPEFCFGNKDSVKYFVDEEKLITQIVSRVYQKQPAINEQQNYEYFSIIEQYTEDLIEDTLEKIAAIPNQEESSESVE